MSYTKFKVGEKEVGIKFGYESYKAVMSDKNRDLLLNEDSTLTPIGIVRIIYSGYQNNCLNKNIEIEFEFEDFSRAVDETILQEGGGEKLKAIISAWEQSTDVQKLIKETSEKKSLTNEPNPSTLTESNSLPLENSESVPGN